MHKRVAAFACNLSLVLMGLLLLGQTRPSDQNGSDNFQDFSITRPRIQDLKGCTFVYSQKRVTLNQLNAVIDPEVHHVLNAIRSQHLDLAGPLILISHGMTPNRDQPFDMQIGFPVENAKAPPPGCQLTQLPGKKFATIIYSGPVHSIGMAYRQIYPAIFGAGLSPGVESRQYFLYWETMDSVNNVVMVAVEVQ